MYWEKGPIVRRGHKINKVGWIECIDEVRHQEAGVENEMHDPTR